MSRVDPKQIPSRFWVALALAGACRGPDGEVGPLRFVRAPELVEWADVPLARELVLATDRPTRLTVRVDDGTRAHEVTFPAFAREHAVPVVDVGPDRDVTVEVVVLDLYGGERREVLAPFRTAPLPPDFPDFDVLTLDADRVEPGFRLLPLDRPDQGFWLAALRAEDGEVAWLYTGEINFGDVRISPDGTMIGLWGGAWEIDLLGRVVRHWERTGGVDPDAIRLPWNVGLNHELAPFPDGTYGSLVFDDFVSPAYPASYDDPTPAGQATIQQERVVRFAADGTALADWSLAERLDPSRIGFDSLDRVSLGFDWSHANAVVPLGDDGSVLVSVRHQDVLVKLDAGGDVAWLLGDPAGWRPPLSERLLAPTPGLSWSYHAHGPSLDDEGRIVVFDNHNDGHTPYSAPPAEEPTSRVVAYRVDEDAGTVTQDWEWLPPVGLPSAALGNAQHLPRTGNVLAGFCFLDGEGGVPNADLGFGRKSVRMIEIVPGEAEPVSDVRVRTLLEQVPDGIKSYRTVAAPSLYPQSVRVDWYR